MTLAFAFHGAVLDQAIAERGAMPLPPYIAGKRPADERDATDYQTLFADEEGSVAAPTAALHFTPDLVARLAARGVDAAQGDAACRRRHVPAGEGRRYRRAQDACRMGRDRRGDRGRAERGARARAGASCRSAPRRCGCWKARRTRAAAIQPFRGETDIFITPGYRFRAADLLMTNFHLPRSTLFMLVSAFSGLETMQRAYAHAIATGYRFYSYGDACLLHPQPA